MHYPSIVEHDIPYTFSRCTFVKLISFILNQSVFITVGSFRSKENDVSKISTSIFVTNFLESFTAKDLFYSYKVYGHVVDNFIPLKRSREGKRFGFVRFINVFKVERLVSNLCTIWVGRIKLHANIARFNKAHTNGNPKSGKPGHVKKDGRNNRNGAFTPRRGVGSMEKGKSFVDVLSGKNRSESMESESSTAIVLDDDCLYSKDLSKSLFGRVKEVTSLSNLKKALINEGARGSKEDSWYGDQQESQDSEGVTIR
nr:nucleotide-binding alpha-beta plait domain-containing protein [Tanacetum cinerariifolium]